MALAFLLDENVPGRILRAIQRHNQHSELALDVVRVGEPHELPLSAGDRTILRWAEEHRHILVTEDKHTMARHLRAHLDAGRHCPGILLIRPGCSVPAIVEFLALVAHASEPHEWRDRIEYVP